MVLGVRKVVKQARRLGHKIEKKLSLGQKSLHKFGHHAKKAGRFGQKVGEYVTYGGVVTGQPEIAGLGTALYTGAERVKRGGRYLEKMTAPEN